MNLLGRTCHCEPPLGGEAISRKGLVPLDRFACENGVVRGGRGPVADPRPYPFSTGSFEEPESPPWPRGARFVQGTKANMGAFMIKGGTRYRIVSDPLGSMRLVINTRTPAPSPSAWTVESMEGGG